MGSKRGFLGLRLDLSQKEMLVGAAKSKGLTLSNYVLLLIRLGLEREKALKEAKNGERSNPGPPNDEDVEKGELKQHGIVKPDFEAILKEILASAKREK